MGAESQEKILSFPKKNTTGLNAQGEPRGKKEIPQNIRRRRLLWLGCMVFFLSWFMISVIIQQFRIWDREARVTEKRQEMRLAKQEMNQLQESIAHLSKEEYMMELAHKLGYRYPDEENYEIRRKP